MEQAARIQPAAYERTGATLTLCAGTRQVRVMELPRACSNRALLGTWFDCFGGGHADLVVWIPWE